MMAGSPRWRSTRADDASGDLPFVEALKRGLAPDGGLYVPTTIPTLPDRCRRVGHGAGRTDTGFADLATAILAPWLTDSFERERWIPAVQDALSFEVPIVELTGAWAGVHVLELFHGPTLSFKDFGARTMARLLAVGAGPDPATRHVFVATSGDTGSAVADGFSGLEGWKVVLLFPKGQVSPVQERQLVARRSGVHSLRVRGTFDDCQRLVKEAFADRRFERFRPTSANSINAGRLLPQMLYYVHARMQVGGLPTFCVPSGNLGNLTAGVLAHLGGLPDSGFVAAHNRNDGFVEFLRGGGAPSSSSVRTVSNAMDVGIPSNFERLDTLLGPKRLRGLVLGDSVTDEDTILSMRRVHEETGYVADPHTAVGLEVVRRLRTGARSGSYVVLSTAHPAKFPDVVARAIGEAPVEPASLAVLRDTATRVRDVDPTLDALLDALSDATDDSTA